MSSEWKATTLGQVCKFIAGSAFKNEYQGMMYGEYPFIKVSDMNLSGNEIFIQTAQNYISEDVRQTLKAKLHESGATVFAKIGVALQSNRRRLLLKPTIIDNNMMSANPIEGVIRSRYLYFLLSTIDFNTISSGSALPYLNVSDLQKIEISLPSDLNEQLKIESFLGALDDRITLLRETNKTLEAITQAIFKSWFIDFDPVRAKMEGRVPVGLDETTAALFPDQLVESELGLLPKGWAPSTVGEVCTYLNRGISPKYAEADGILVLNQKCIRDFQIDFSKGRRHDSNQRKVDGRLLAVGDILVNSTGVGTLGRVAQILGLNAPAIVDSHVTVVRASETITWTYLGEYMKKMQPTIESMGEGSTGQTELSRSKLADLKILTPSQNVTQLFDSIVKPLKKRIFTNQESAFTLSHLRDTLLPRLISGRLGLSKFEEGVL